MSVHHDSNAPIVEPPTGGDVPGNAQQPLDQRIRQQEILSDLGVIALQGGEMHALLSETVRLVAEGLRSEFCKVLEFVPADNCFTVRAGVGWGPDVVGVAQVGSDLSSPAGFALKTGKPVISNHLGNEQRFRTRRIAISLRFRPFRHWHFHRAESRPLSADMHGNWPRT